MSGLFKSPKAPAPINVGQVTQQAAAQNTANAFQNAAFNRLNQTDQFGNSLSYSQAGTDAQGNPRFQVNQQLGDTGQMYAGGLAGLGQRYFQTAGQGVPDSSAAFNQAYDLASANLEPRFQRTRDAEINRLRNQGLDPTSEAYKSQMNDIALQQNEARNNLVTNLQGQMFNQGLQSRQQMIGELNPGVQFGNQVLNPNLVNTPQVGVQNVDVAGLTNQAKGQEWQAYNAKMQDRNAMLGGLAGIGGTLLGSMVGMPQLGGMLGSTVAGSASNGGWSTTTTPTAYGAMRGSGFGNLY